MLHNKPNILLITTDQQRYDTVPPMAPSFMRTPHFDILAREGITYSSAYAECPMCVPSRVSIMTGKSVLTTSVTTNCNTSDVMGREGTLPTLLSELGYQTAAIGKMHFGPQRVRHGFEEMIIPEDYYKEMLRSGSQFQPMRHGLGQNELYPTMATVPEALTLTSWTAEKCVDYIRERRDPTVPFFLWCSFSKPHPPLDPPEPYYSMYRNYNIPEPVFGDWSENGKCPEAFKRFRESWSCDLVKQEVIKEARAAYYGLITQIDYNMGRIFSALQDVGLFNNTLIVYTSDHGEYLGDHHMGGKFFFHEPSAHVPFVIRLPKCWDNRCAGTTVSSPVTHADILPTLLAAAKGDLPAGIDGQDIIALAHNELDQPHRYVEGVSEIPGNEFIGITDGKWKYIWYPEGAAEQLFNIEEDPNELKNLACCVEFTDKLGELKHELIRRHILRKSRFVKDDKLVIFDIKGDSVNERRNNSWPGFHTDYFDDDVRH